jgi:hypothetical protein
MLPQQKEAIFTFISSVVFTLLLLLLVPLFSVFRSEAILVLFVLFILTLWVVRSLTGLRFKALDEMDKTIRLQAAIIAIHGFGATVAIYALTLYLIHGATLVVPVHQVLQLALYSWLALYAFWSGSILILYRRGAFHV